MSEIIRSEEEQKTDDLDLKMTQVKDAKNGPSIFPTQAILKSQFFAMVLERAMKDGGIVGLTGSLVMLFQAGMWYERLSRQEQETQTKVPASVEKESFLKI